jgi:hypothetical protein
VNQAKPTITDKTTTRRDHLLGLVIGNRYALEIHAIDSYNEYCYNITHDKGF